MKTVFCSSLLIAGALVCGGVQAQQASSNMSFFITSMGKGDGANLGGLAGADAHCATLAKAAGSTKANWRAYLSTTPVQGGAPPGMPVTASARVHGSIPKESPSPAMSMICTAPS